MSRQGPDPLIGRVLRGIEIRRRIGEGGMGYVYEGYQPQLERKIAVKVMTREHAQSPEAVTYFMREARASSQVRHPNIIQIIDFGQEPDGLLFLAMEFVPGRPLSDLIKDELPLSARRICALLTQTLAGLQEAHAHGLVHRDLKPDNLMVERTRSGDDLIKILDFGVAHRQDAERTPQSLTAAGALLGTPQYMSPEQACGQRVDGRSDLFAVGVILYELLTGALPFAGQNLPELLMAIVSAAPVGPSARRPDWTINPDLEAICLRALQKERDLRYQSAQEMREALLEVQRTGSYRPVPKPAQPAQLILKRRRHGADSRQSPADDSPRPPEPLNPSPVEADLPELGQALSDALVVDVNSLLSSQEAMPSPGRAALGGSPPLEPSTPSPAPATAPGLSWTGLADALREDLLGATSSIVALVIHQRVMRAMDADALRASYDLLDHLSDQLAARWGGLRQGRQGGAVTIVFGSPQAARDDAARAAMAALELLARQRDELDVQYGLAMACGESFCEPGAGPLATRLCGLPLDEAADGARQATDGQLLIVGEDLRQTLQERFMLGAPTPSGAWPLLGERAGSPPTPSASAASSSAAVLVGRDRELASLLAALNDLERGHGQVITLVGPGGVGKSALLEQLQRLSQARQLLWLRACARHEGALGARDALRQWIVALGQQLGQPQQPLRQVFHELGVGHELAAQLEGFAQGRLHEQLGAASGGAEILAGQLIAIAAQLVWGALSKRQPVILALDQLQRLDAPWRELLWRVERSSAQGALLLIVASREVDQGVLEGAQRLALAPLQERDCAALARARLPDHPEALHRQIASLCGGQPLRLVKLIEAVLAHPEADHEALSRAISRDPDVRDLMRQELQRLPRAQQNVLALLAVLGPAADASTLDALAPAQWELEEALNALLQAQLIELEPAWPQDGLVTSAPLISSISIVSPIFAQVILQSLPERARLRAHAQVVAHLTQRLVERGSLEGCPEATSWLRQLTRHHEALGHEEAARDATRRLAQLHMARHEHELAEVALKRALERAGDATLDPQDAALALMLARAQRAQGRAQEALALLARWQRVAPRALEDELRLELASLWIEQEDPQLIEAQLVRLIELTRRAGQVQPEDRAQAATLARALTLWGAVHERLRRHAQAILALIEAVELCERAALGPQDSPWGAALIWEPLNQLGRLRFKANDLDAAQRLYELAHATARDARDARGLITTEANLSALWAARGDLEQATQRLQRGLKLARRHGLLRLAAKLLHNCGLLYLRQHLPELARECFEQSDELCQLLDWREGIALNSAQLRRG